MIDDGKEPDRAAEFERAKREPLVDRVRAEYERRRQERRDPPLVTGQPGLVTRPHDWTKGASMDEAATVTVGYEDGQEEDVNLDEHLKKWHRLPLDHSWDDEHLQRVHDQDHQGGGFDYHAHPLPA